MLCIDCLFMFALLSSFDFFFGGGGIFMIYLGYFNVPAAQQPQSIRELEAAIRLDCTNTPKVVILRAFVGEV